MTELMTQLIFFAFAAVLVLSSMMVTLSHRSVHAILWLILAFVATSGLWILIQAEFLGLVLIVVYVGAVMTLFLFVVMMLNLGEESAPRRFSKSWLPLITAFLVMIVTLFLLILSPNYATLDNSAAAVTSAISSQSNLVQLGLALFREDALSMELAAVILLVSVIGALYLTHRRRENSKKQNIAAQIRVSKKDRLRIVTMASEKST